MLKGSTVWTLTCWGDFRAYSFYITVSLPTNLHTRKGTVYVILADPPFIEWNSINNLTPSTFISSNEEKDNAFLSSKVLNSSSFILFLLLHNVS